MSRDLQAYAEARKYLLGLPGVTETLLAHYLTPAAARLEPTSLRDVYLRLVESAQNRGMMATVIGKSLGGIRALDTVLCSFDPSAVATRYQTWNSLLDTIESDLHPRGKIRRNPGSLWPLFARAALSGSRFLSQFSDLADFTAWVQTFDQDPRRRAALPLLLSHEVEGFGFALACDFVKELGYLNFAKPDVHVATILKGLELCQPKADDYLVFKAVVRIALNCDVTPYHADKLFWLIGSGNFYDHLELGKAGRVATDRSAFISETHKVLFGAA